MRPFLHGASLTVVAAGLVLLMMTMSTLHAGETKLNYGLDLGAGHESNPLRMMNDGSGAPFAQLRADGAVRHTVNNGFVLFATADAYQRWYGTDAGDADYSSGSLSAGIGVSPALRGRSLTLVFGGQHRLTRSTYTDRITGQVYAVESSLATDPPTSIAIPDRFDYDMTGVFFNVRWKQNRRLGFHINASLDQARYSEDYSATTDLEPLDFRALVVEPGTSMQIHRVAVLGVSIVLTDQEYDERAALDAGGTILPGTLREYRHIQYRMNLKLTPAERWTVNLGLRNADRDDTTAGYYDYGSTASFVSVQRTTGLQGRLSLHLSRRDLDYDNATVWSDPAETLGDDVQRTIGRYEHRVGDGLRWFVEAGVQDTDSRDPEFSYNSEWMVTGIRFRR